MTTLLIIALTPEGFQTAIMAWLAVISAVVVAVTGLVVFLTPKVLAAVQQLMEAWAKIQGKQEEQSKRLDSQRTTLERHSTEINDINKELPPTGRI